MAVLLGRMWPWHGEGMVPFTAQVGQCVGEEGLCAALEWRAVNMGVERRCGREVWGCQTCFYTLWVLGPCHGAGQGMGCSSWGPEMGKRPVLDPSLDLKPGTGCQALRAGVAHAGAALAGPCPMAARGDAGDKVPPHCPPRLCRPGR